MNNEQMTATVYTHTHTHEVTPLLPQRRKAVPHGTESGTSERHEFKIYLRKHHGTGVQRITKLRRYQSRKKTEVASDWWNGKYLLFHTVRHGNKPLRRVHIWNNIFWSEQHRKSDSYIDRYWSKDYKKQRDKQCNGVLYRFAVISREAVSLCG